MKSLGLSATELCPCCDFHGFHDIGVKTGWILEKWPECAHTIVPATIAEVPAWREATCQGHGCNSSDGWSTQIWHQILPPLGTCPCPMAKVITRLCPQDFKLRGTFLSMNMTSFLTLPAKQPSEAPTSLGLYWCFFSTSRIQSCKGGVLTREYESSMNWNEVWGFCHVILFFF